MKLSLWLLVVSASALGQLASGTYLVSERLLLEARGRKRTLTCLWSNENSEVHDPP